MLIALITSRLLLLFSGVLLKTKMNTSLNIPFTYFCTDAQMPYIITQKTRERLSRPEGIDAMATNGNQTRMEASLAARRISPPAASRKPGKGVKHPNNNQEVQRYSEHLWLSKQRSSPSLLFYRKLSDDSSEGAASNEEYDCVDCGAKILASAQKVPAQPSALRTTSWEEGPGGDATRNGAVRSCRCTSPDTSTSSPTSSASPADSPHLASSLARPHPRHSRRSSMPVSTLPFHKVVRNFQRPFGCNSVESALEVI